MLFTVGIGMHWISIGLAVLLALSALIALTFWASTPDDGHVDGRRSDTGRERRRR